VPLVPYITGSCEIGLGHLDGLENVLNPAGGLREMNR
jgi:hypothetical protein